MGSCLVGAASGWSCLLQLVCTALPGKWQRAVGTTDKLLAAGRLARSTHVPVTSQVDCQCCCRQLGLGSCIRQGSVASEGAASGTLTWVDQTCSRAAAPIKAHDVVTQGRRSMCCSRADMQLLSKHCRLLSLLSALPTIDVRNGPVKPPLPSCEVPHRILAKRQQTVSVASSHRDWQDLPQAVYTPGVTKACQQG